MRGNYSVYLNKKDISFVLTVNNNYNEQNDTHLITKMASVNNTMKISMSNITKSCKILNIDKLYIISIVMNDAYENEYVELKESCQIIYIRLGVISFIENYLRNPNQDFWEYNKHTLYILRNADYSFIQKMFTSIHNTRIQIVRGNPRKSQILSPVDVRLSYYMLILCNMNSKKFNYNNSFNTTRYLPLVKNNEDEKL